MRRMSIWGRSRSFQLQSGAGVAKDLDGEALDRALRGYEKTFGQLQARLQEVEEEWRKLARLIQSVPEIAATCWGSMVTDKLGTLGQSLPPGAPVAGLEEVMQLNNKIKRIRVLWRKRKECVDNRALFRRKLAELQAKSPSENKERKIEHYQESIVSTGQEVEGITSIIQEHIEIFDKEHSQILANVLRGFAEANQRRTASDPFGPCLALLTKLAGSPPEKTLLQLHAQGPDVPNPPYPLPYSVFPRVPSHDNLQRPASVPPTPPPAARPSSFLADPAASALPKLAVFPPGSSPAQEQEAATEPESGSGDLKNQASEPAIPPKTPTKGSTPKAAVASEPGESAERSTGGSYNPLKQKHWRTIRRLLRNSTKLRSKRTRMSSSSAVSQASGDGNNPPSNPSFYLDGGNRWDSPLVDELQDPADLQKAAESPHPNGDVVAREKAAAAAAAGVANRPAVPPPPETIRARMWGPANAPDEARRLVA